MAKSPAVLPPGAAVSMPTPSKTRSVTNGKAHENPSSTKPLANDSSLELAEQLNKEVKQKYVKGKEVGSGTYAKVYIGHRAGDPSALVAIKKIMKIDVYKDGLFPGTIREINFLQELSHPNIIALYDVFSTKDQNMNLVLEYLPLGDLEQLIKDTKTVIYGPADIKAWMGMLGRAVWFCHKNFVLHRDIKPNNLLIAADGELKLADFGLSRSFADPGQKRMSHEMITRWYRPPELFYRAHYYSGVVDVWSMGCVFAELILRVAFLPGSSDINQLQLISERIGTPTEENWLGVSKLEGFVPHAPSEVVPVKTHQDFMRVFGAAGSVGVELLMAMLTLNPQTRATSKQVLQHKWWATEPRPSKKEDLPRKGGGEEKMGEDLKRRGGELPQARADKVARKIDFGALKKNG